jgi:Holliday junction resolvasome RuvABC ATP-dependent DNA helicase subunit
MFTINRMPKRDRDMEKHKDSDKKRRPRIKLTEAPPINSITDLIELGQSIKFYKNLDNVMLWRITPYLEELDQLVGMQSLKDSVFYQILYYIQGMNARNQSEEYLHTVLMGPPGTGKTTVAQIIAKIYQGMGILSKDGPFKIAHRDDFIAGYLGQTSIKTQRLLKSCLGGVLFIDEVYALGPGQEDKDSFSKEAIDALTSFLSEHTSDFCCIAAGYEKDIQKCFFAVNSGLESRFQWKHTIDPYSSEDLAEIFVRKVEAISWELAVDKIGVSNVIGKNKSLFTNAGRDVINFVSKCKIVHARRVITLDKKHKFILVQEDLENGATMMKKNVKIEEDSPPPFGMFM